MSNHIHSQPTSTRYRENFDLIFSRRPKIEEKEPAKPAAVPAPVYPGAKDGGANQASTTMPAASPEYRENFDEAMGKPKLKLKLRS